MNSNFEFGRIQQALAASSIEGWLFYGFQQVDPIALRILGFREGAHISRRWFYLIPARGEACKLVHRIESAQLDHLPGRKTQYVSRSELKSGLSSMLSGLNSVAMQYSPQADIPYVSRVDAGTIELVREAGVEVTSSASLLQIFEARLSPAQARQHRETASALTRIVQETFTLVAGEVESGAGPREYDVQQMILRAFADQSLVCDHPPIVAINENSGNPHYAPPASNSRQIRRDDFLLIDLWARPGTPDAVYADITWTGFLGGTAPPSVREVFDLAREARDAAVDFLERGLGAGRTVQGWEVDRVTRGIIEAGGHGDRIMHRTGHNIGHNVHGNGVNFDDVETHDTREVIPGVLCSVEPGIYLPEFGVRTEIDVLVLEGGIEVTTPPQQELLLFDL